MVDSGRARTGGSSKVIAVAWREFRHTALTKGFIIGAVAVPVMMVLVISAIALLMDDKDRTVSGTMAVLDPSGTVAPLADKLLIAQNKEGDEDEKAVQKQMADVTQQLGSPAMQAAAQAAMAPRINVKVENYTDPDKETELRQQVRDGKLLALAIVPANILKAQPERINDQDPQFSMILPGSSPPRTTQRLERAVANAIVEARVTAAGKDYPTLKALLTRPSAELRNLSAKGEESKESVAAKMIAPAGFMFLLWIATFTSGNYLLTSTIEEKSSKVMEVLLSAVSPMQLLLGKILGYALVSIVMLVSYGALAMAGLTFASLGGLVQWDMLVYLVIYFVMAYLFVATIMVSVGSAVSDLREAQSLIGPAMIVLTVPLMLWMPISDNPTGWLATICSFIPPAIPFVMILRTTASAENVPMWQILLSMVWGFTCVFIFLWSGAKIFRVGVLMQGKPPTPRELLRWIRMA